MTSSPEWHASAGLLEQIENGAAPEDLQSSAAAVSTMRGAGAPDRFLKWLQGYRRTETLVTRRPLWIQLAELWPAPESDAELSYGAAKQSELGAELTLFGAFGLGTSSKVVLSSAITTDASDTGRAIEILSCVTVTRYVHKDNGSALDRIDVDNSGMTPEIRTRDLEIGDFPLPGREIFRKQLDAERFVARDIVRAGASAKQDKDKWSPRVEVQHSWSFEFSLPDVPALVGPLKISAGTSHSQSFEAKFDLPRGHDYLFFDRFGERPIVPWCARLKPEG